MAELIGTVTSIRVAVSRKMGDGDYGSYGVDAAVEVALPVGANVADAFDAWDAWLTASVGASMKEKGELIAKNKPAPKDIAQQLTESAEAANKIVSAIQAAPVAEIRTPVTDSGDEYRMIEVDYFEVSVDANNIRVCKVHGGPYKKFGVRCWPEPLEGIGIKLETLEAGKFSLPDGYKQAKVLMVEGKPKKVWAFTK